MTLEQVDTFSLKRSCYMPKVISSPLAENQKELTGFDEASPLNEERLKALHLTAYFKTAEGETSFHNALFLCFALALASVNKTKLIKTYQFNETVQKAIIVLYFQKKLDKNALKSMFSDPNYADALAAQMPTIANRDPSTIPNSSKTDLGLNSHQSKTA